MHAKIFVLFILCLPIAAQSAVLTLKEVDYGVGAEPLGPGEEGPAFVTLENSTAEELREIVLEPHAGECVRNASGTIRISQLAPGASIRASDPLQISLSPDCNLGAGGRMLLIGTYLDSISSQQRIWSEMNFPVGRPAEIHFLADNLHLPIPDESAVDHKFTIPQSVTIQEIGVYVRGSHTYQGDISVFLVSPTGLTVTLWRGTGSLNGPFEFRIGWNGTYSNDLARLIGHDAKGVWTLRVMDSARDDVGYLEAVGLDIK